jgi:hypothetical protein
MEILMQTEKTREQHRWEKAVSKFSEIPDNRKTASPENLRWFLRNGAVLIHKYPEVQEAIQYAQKALDRSG